MMERAFAWGLFLAAALVGPAACQPPLGQFQCRDIPAGGCPGQDPGICIDPTCQAVYTCQPDGTWVHALDCPPHEGGVDAPAPFDAGDASTSLPDVSFDVPGAGGGPGCMDLQAPDCPLSVALACGPPVCCGCEDLFVCSDGGWDHWGSCIDGGIEPDTPPDQ